MQCFHILTFQFSAGSMGSRTIPFLITFSDSQKDSIPHIDRNNHTLTLPGGNRALPKDSGLIQIIMRNGKLIQCFPFHPLQYFPDNDLPVPLSVLLNDCHVFQISLLVFTLQITHIIGNLSAAFSEASGSQLRIIFCHFLSQMPAAGVHHKVYGTVLRPVKLYEMIPAPKRTKASFRLLLVNMTGTVKRLIRKFPGHVMRLSPYGKSGGYIFPDHFIQFLKFNIAFIQFYTGHSAADIHSQKLRDYSVLYCHGQPYGSCLSGMYIRHHADPASLRHLIITYHFHLCFSVCIYIIRKYFCLGINTFYYFHTNLHDSALRNLKSE